MLRSPNNQELKCAGLCRDAAAYIKAALPRSEIQGGGKQNRDK